MISNDTFSASGKNSKKRHFLWIAVAVGLLAFGGIGLIKDVDVSRTDGEVTEKNKYVPGRSLVGNYLSGRFAYTHGDSPQASKYLLRALVKDPTNEELKRQLYHAYILSGEIPEAIAMAEKLPSGTEGLVDSNLLLVLQEVKKGDVRKAKEYLKQVERQGFNAIFGPLFDVWLDIDAETQQEPVKLTPTGA